MHMLRGTDNCFYEFIQNKSSLFVKKKNEKKRKEKKKNGKEILQTCHIINAIPFNLKIWGINKDKNQPEC